jgi:Flp pilus assembly protein TadG
MKRSNQQSRRGILSMELVFTLPILMLLLFGIFEYSLLCYARGSVVEASRNGARAASYPGATEESIEMAVLQTLGPILGRNALIEAELGTFTGDPVLVVVRVPMQHASPDLMWPVGFSLQGRYLVAETVMQRE